MLNRFSSLCLVFGLCAYFLTGGTVAQAYIIGDSDIMATTGNEVASGTALLDLALFTDPSASTTNEFGSFNGDNANTDTASGTATTMAEAYVCSIGDLRDYYRTCFPDGDGGSTVDSMSLFIDLNQTGQSDFTIDVFNVVIDYDTSFGDDRDEPWAGDVATALQNSTTDGWSWQMGEPSPVGGIVLSTIDSPKALASNPQAAEWADYVIRLGINPFDGAFSDDMSVLFYWASSGHDSASETIFLSGQYTVPEPATLLLLGLGMVMLRKKA